jgi:hypothetical protein
MAATPAATPTLARMSERLERLEEGGAVLRFEMGNEPVEVDGRYLVHLLEPFGLLDLGSARKAARAVSCHG